MQGGRDSHQGYTTLQHALGQFLDKERHAVGALGDLGDDLLGQCLVAGDLLDQRGPVAPVQAIERHYSDLRLAGQGGRNSGRNVTISSTGRLQTRSTVRSNSSREVGSIQCASSKTMTTGWRRAKLSRCRISASSVRSFLRCGPRFGSGWRSEAGNDSRSAINATSSSGGAVLASKASS